MSQLVDPCKPNEDPCKPNEATLTEKQKREIEEYIETLGLTPTDKEYLHLCLAEIMGGKESFVCRLNRRLDTKKDATEIKETMSDIYKTLGGASNFQPDVYWWMVQMLFERLDNQSHKTVKKPK